jgi:hypothetical protein
MQAYFANILDMVTFYNNLNNQAVWAGLVNALGLPCDAEASYTDVFYSTGSAATGVIAVLVGAPVSGIPLQLILPGTPCRWPMDGTACLPPAPSLPFPPPPPPSPPPMPCTITAHVNRTAGPFPVPDPCSLFVFFMRSSYGNGINVSDDGC